MLCIKNVSTNIQLIMEEHFAGSCTTACDNPNNSDALKAVCDTGSQQFCSNANNIFTPNCKSYLTRVTGNAAADKLAQSYANPLKFTAVAGKPTATASDYYNALSATILTSTTNPTNLISTDTSDIVSILKANNPSYATDLTYKTLIGRAFEYCGADPNANAGFCSETATPLSWGAAEFSKIIRDLIESYTKLLNGSSIVAFYTKNTNPLTAADQTAKTFKNMQIAHTRMPNTLKPADDFILSTLTASDLLDPNLVVLRQVSPYLQTGIDTFVINLVNGTKNSFTHERLSVNPGMYSANLSSTPALYGTNFRTFISNIQAYATANKITTTDPLISLVQMTDNTIITTCTTGNPSTNPICSQISTVMGSDAAASILNAQVKYCSDPANISSTACISNINSNQKVYNMNDVNTKMLNYCLSAGGQNDTNCKPFSTIKDSNTWLKTVTKNTTDAAGVTTSVCGTPGNLSKDTCQNVCKVYPDLCAADIQQKCAAPANRYSTNIDFFEGGQVENMENPDAINWMTIVVGMIFILLLALLAVLKYQRPKWLVNYKPFRTWFMRNSTD